MPAGAGGSAGTRFGGIVVSGAPDTVDEELKGLRMLFHLVRELADPAVPFAVRLQRAVVRLPLGWEGPECTEARISLGGHVCVTPGFRKTPRTVSSDIRSGERVIGTVEIASMDSDPGDPFSLEARDLLEAVAMELSLAAERERRQAELSKAEKLEAVGRLAGGVAHDFNNLLMVVQGHAEMALEGLPPGSPLEVHIDQILGAGRRGAGLTRQLLAFSRKQALQEDFMELRHSLTVLQPMLRALIPESIDIHLEPGLERGPIKADCVKIDQVIVNLVANAADAIGSQGTVTLRVDSRTVSKAESEGVPWRMTPGRYASLTVQDTGSGIPPEIVEHVFEPFFTTKPDGHGTGLGLSVAYGIVKQSGGHIMVDSRQGEGTTIEVLLPLVDDRDAEDARSPGAAEKEADPSVSDPVTVLLVEDNASVRETLARILERAGHRVLTASNGREALEIVGCSASSGADGIGLIMSDVVMPEMGGGEFLDSVREIRPDMKVVLMSGYSEAELTDGIRHKAAAFLEKPFSPRDVTKTIRDALA